MSSNRNGTGGVTLALAIGACLVATIAVVAVGFDRTPRAAVDAVGQAGLPSTAEVDLAEFSITPVNVTANAGPLTLTVKNTGTMAHNLSVPDLGLKTVDLNAGASAVLDLGDVAAGTYQLICEIAGHADSGMKGTLTVGAGGATAASMPGMDH